MSFDLSPREKPGEGLARVIHEQVGKLDGECADALEHVSAFAHKARVRAKRVRAALRLARPLMGDKRFKVENAWWRDSARLLSELRDASARLEALESLKPFLAERIGAEATQKLAERFEAGRQSVDAAAAIGAFRAALDERRDRLVPKLETGKRETSAEALGETYRAARRAMKAALETGDPLLLHEWRKQSKYHALQSRLLRAVFPVGLAGRVEAVRALAEVLGQVQDIEVVAEGAKDWDDAPEGFFEVLEARRGQLVAEARLAGEKLFATKTKAWMRSLGESGPPELKLVGS